MSDFLQTLIFGLAIGGVIGVSAVGLSLSYGVTRFINFSYGELLTLGAYVTVLIMSLGSGHALAIGGAIIAVGIIGVILARVFFAPLRERGSMALLVTSVGLAFVLHYIVQMVAGSNPIRFPMPLLRPWTFGPVFVPKVPVMVIVIALVTMLIVHLILRYTLIGKMMRATSDNPSLARVAGIRANRVLDVTWFMSSAIAALGGVLLAMTQVVLLPSMGWSFLLVVFAAVLLGGIGSPYGAMLGALIVGLGLEFGTAYISANYSHAFAFIILVLVLLFKPRGLMGGAH